MTYETVKTLLLGRAGLELEEAHRGADHRCRLAASVGTGYAHRACRSPRCEILTNTTSVVSSRFLTYVTRASPAESIGCQAIVHGSGFPAVGSLFIHPTGFSAIISLRRAGIQVKADAMVLR